MYRPILTALASLTLLAACNTNQAPGASSRGEALFETCQQCHGADGLGRQEINAPAIVGLPDWYIKSTLEKFQRGGRGTHFDDISGMQMRPMALTLNRPGDIEAVTAIVTKLPATAPHKKLSGGNADAGAKLYEACKQCHGAEAAGDPAKFAPPLTHTNDWYMLSSLKKFKAGVRGGDAVKDPSGATMRPMAQLLADEQAMKDVIAYVKSIKQ